MAKYTVNFSCGHTEEIELVGKYEERKRKIQWYEECGLCPHCYAQKRAAEKAAEAAAQAAELQEIFGQLPPLTGTEKQIAYAAKVRAEDLQSLMETIDTRTRFNEKAKETALKYVSAWAKAPEHTSSRFWLDLPRAWDWKALLMAVDAWAKEHPEVLQQ